MSFLSNLKENALTIAVIIIILAILLTVYNQFFSDKAKIIKMLKDQVKEQEEIIANLRSQYHDLLKEEEKRLQQINELKEKLTNIQETIKNGEVKIDDIKEELIELDSALSIIEDHTRGAISYGRGIMDSDTSSTGK